jgi:TonB family protein
MTLLIASAIKISFVLLAALSLCALLRRRSAALRHWLLAASLACSAAIPVLQLVVPAWSLSAVTTFAPPVAQAPAAAPADAGTRAQATASATSRASARVAAARPRAALTWWGVLADASRRQVLLAGWLAGLILSLAVLLAGLWRLAQVASTSRRSDAAPWTGTLATLSQHFGIRRPVVVFESDHPSLLVTWGWRRPRILIPAAARQWPAERLQVVFAHELAHVQRGDWIVQIAADLWRAVFWFNPLVWLACQRLRQESEHACDDAVLNAGVEPPAYATHLLDLARAFSRHRRTWLPAPAIARPSSLERRVTAMLTTKTSRTPITRAGRIAAVVALLAVTLPPAGLAQGGATVTGSARDESGGLLPGLRVTLELQDPQRPPLTVSTVTSRLGAFEFSGLPNGRYLLQGQLPGFTTYTEAFTLTVNGRLQKDLALRIGGLQETITVDGTNPPDNAHAYGIQALRRSRGSVPPPAPRVVRDGTEIGGNIKAPRKIWDVRPDYPPAAFASGIGGVVVLQATIGGDGFVTDVRVLRTPNEDLARAAADAVSQWEFTPTLLNGAPVDVHMNVTINFNPRQ